MRMLPLFAIVLAVFASPAGAASPPREQGGTLPHGSATDAQAPSRPVAAATSTRAPKRRMHIGFYVNAVRDINWASESFLADFYWWIRYPKPASEEEKRLTEALEFVNGNLGIAPGASATGLQHETQQRKTIPGAEGDEEYVSFRTVGRFYFSADFHAYPFDRQRLPIMVEHEVLTTDELEFVDDTGSYGRSGEPEARWGIAPTISIEDLTIERATRKFSTQEYRTNFGDTTVREAATRFARVTFTIEATRDSRSYLIKILIPLLIILILAYLVFFIPARDLEVAVGLTVTSILACIAFQLTVASDLPNIGYVVTSDRIFHLCYFLIMTAMAETVYTHNLERRGGAATAARIEHWSRYLYPLVFVAGIVAIVLSGLAAR